MIFPTSFGGRGMWYVVLISFVFRFRGLSIYGGVRSLRLDVLVM